MKKIVDAVKAAAADAQPALAVAARQGLHELGQILVCFPSHGVTPVDLPGGFGNPTSQEVTAERAGTENQKSDYDSFLAERAASAPAAEGKGKEPEMDMG